MTLQGKVKAFAILAKIEFVKKNLKERWLQLILLFPNKFQIAFFSMSMANYHFKRKAFFRTPCRILIKVWIRFAS